MNIRQAQPKDFENLFALWADTWNRGEPYEPENQKIQEGQTAFVALEDENLCGAWLEHSVPMSRGITQFSSVGIAAVAVPVPYRHAGVGKQMMQAALRQMHERGIAIASLYAFRESYYRQFGYEVCGLRYKVTCPRECLPGLKPSLPIRRIAPENLHELKPCYDIFANQYSGMWMRGDREWTRRMGKKPPMIFAVGNPVQAYATTSMDGGFWEDLRFGEVVWSSREGYLSIIAAMEALCINRSAIIWNEPSRSPFLTEFMQEKTPVVSERLVMYRIAHLESALRALKPSVPGQFRMQVTDSVIEANNRVWQVEFGVDEVTVTESAESAALSVDIRHLTQAVMGEPCFSDLVKLGLVQVNDAAAIKEAQKLFTTECVACYDYF